MSVMVDDDDDDDDGMLCLACVAIGLAMSPSGG
jgi:hypothetical protein